MSDTVALPTSPMAGPTPGKVIAEKYRLEREIGRGAMGTVWSATHVTLGQRVAIKLIASEHARSPEARVRFAIEAKAAARLRSRHAVQIHDDGETPDGMPYIVMEYLEGETLEQRLESQRDLGLSEAVRITMHVGRALARAHAQGVVHRDLKSGNVFIAKSDDDEYGWVAKVLDFGVAKVLTEVSGPSATKTGTIVGTPLFMSPEQIRGASQVDHRADLYSLGMVFYNMVTGSHAFDGPSYSDVLVAICTETLPDIRSAAPWLPTPLKSWFDKACAREREARFQSADEMIEALQDAAGPAARMTRPSIPEETAGPSGTLLGHVPPHAAATLLATPLADLQPPSRGILVSEPKQPPKESTLRSPPDPANPTASLGKRRLPRDLPLWAATGVGLAVATVALVLVLGRTAPASAPRARTPNAVATIERTVTAVATPPVTTPPPALAPSLLPAAPLSTPASTPLPPPRQVSAPQRRLAVPARSSVPATRKAVLEKPTPAPTPARPAAPRPAAASAEPDMGF